MLKTIKAEFEQFDSAEIASRRIRRNVNGIRKIKIASHNRGKKHDGNELYVRYIPTTIANQNYMAPAVISSIGESDESAVVQTTFLTVVCTEEASAKVHNILTSSGGLSITLETFIP